jgi:hypothetical protein
MTSAIWEPLDTSPARYSRPGWLLRRDPAERLTTVTVFPCSRRRRVRLLPINPAPPITITLSVCDTLDADLRREHPCAVDHQFAGFYHGRTLGPPDDWSASTP